MAYGSPVANGAFEQFQQGLSPGLAALSAGIQQRNSGLWSDYHLQRLEQIKHSQEVDNANTLLALNPDLKEHLDAAGIDSSHVGYPAAVQYLHAQKQANLPIQRQAIKDAVEQRKSDAVGDQMVHDNPTAFGDPQQGSTGLAETIQLPPRGMPLSSMVELQRNQQQVRAQNEREQVAADKLRQQEDDKDWYAARSTHGAAIDEAAKYGWTTAATVDAALSQMTNDPVFKMQPLQEQRRLQLQILGAAHAQASDFLALHAQKNQDAKDAMEQARLDALTTALGDKNAAQAEPDLSNAPGFVAIRNGNKWEVHPEGETRNNKEQQKLEDEASKAAVKWSQNKENWDREPTNDPNPEHLQTRFVKPTMQRIQEEKDKYILIHGGKVAPAAGSVSATELMPAQAAASKAAVQAAIAKGVTDRAELLKISQQAGQ